MVNLFDHSAQLPMFFLQMFPQRLHHGVHVLSYGGIARLRLFVVASDEAKEPTNDIGIMCPEFISGRVTFAVDITRACHISVLRCNKNEISN